MRAIVPGYHLFDTAFGVCGLAWSASGITRLQLPERDRVHTDLRLQARSEGGSSLSMPSAFEGAVEALRRYFDGRPEPFSGIELDITGVPPFFREIYRLTREIAWGSTATYGKLAELTGAPGSARAVGQAMARNPIPVIIPCHRVLAANRKPGGFSAFGGLVTKERLLALEGASLGAELPLFAGLGPMPLKSSADIRS